MTPLKQLRDKIVKVIPEIVWEENKEGQARFYRKITLEDILIVLNKKWNDERFATGESMEELWGLYCEWQLGKNLEQQSTDTIKYLNEII